MNRIHAIAWVLVGLATAGAARGEVRLAEVIRDNAVLQRDAKVGIWGRAEADEKITVIFAGQTRRASADAFGRWRVELEPMGASSEGRTLTASSPAGTVEVRNVVVGDVWLYLTMAFHLNEKSPLRAREPDAASLPTIRFHRASDLWEQRTHSRRARAAFGRDRRGRWTLYKPPGKYFANDAYYLGVGLGSQTRVPVGAMALGASTLEAMTPPEGFRHWPPELSALAERVASWTPTTPRGRQAYLASLGEIGEWIARTRAVLARADVTFADLAPPPVLPGPPAFERAPTTQYNDVAHRYMPATVRGLILEPGCQSVSDVHYAAKARALVRGLREAMGRELLPVCFVQTHCPHRYETNFAKDPNDWARARAAQASLMRSEKNLTVVATYDGDPKNRDALKIDRPLRVAQWAAAVVRGQAVRTGPVYKAHRIDGTRIVIEFDHVGAGLLAGRKEPVRPVQPDANGTLRGFEIADERGLWQKATAAIEGRTVVVTAPVGARGRAVRYAWAPRPFQANLYNREGFPALPFDTSRESVAQGKPRR